MMKYPDTSTRHLRFQYHSLNKMKSILKSKSKELCIRYGDALDVFSEINQKYNINKVFSYRESGIDLTFKRDKNLIKFFKQSNISWQECQRDGILRGIKNRKNWSTVWKKMIESPLYNSNFEQSTIEYPTSFGLPEDLKTKWEKYPAKFQPAGEIYAWRYLESFFSGRGRKYRSHISKPTQSRLSCSRLSPYLAWGNISPKQVYHFTKNHPDYHFNPSPYNAFLTRLQWRCHFIQKFEVECEYETHCINRGYEFLEYENNDDKLEAWKKGRTGVPLVDANMRCLIKTGWINFRMRAMLVSFLCYHLDQDWRRGVYHLARLFLDYEPGIHYPQFQMQAGTTGVNIIRMYNPLKQSKDQDPDARFIKQWLPEVADFEVHDIHHPSARLKFNDEQDYPDPIVDIVKAGRIARDKIWGHREHKLVKQESRRIVRVHTKNHRKNKT